MQAYARAQLPPLETESLLPSIRSVMPAAVVAVNGEAIARFDRAASFSAVLASLILDALDEHHLAVLASRLLPYLRHPVDPKARGHIAYTVASLAIELGVSEKAIRCAIARRELAAVKRGSRWIISADAVQTWATASAERRRASHACTPPAPKAAGPSLRSILCGASQGGPR